MTGLPSNKRKPLSNKEAAEYLGISVQKLNGWRHMGRGPKYARLSPRTIAYLPEWLDEFIEENSHDPKSGKARRDNPTDHIQK